MTMNTRTSKTRTALAAATLAALPLATGALRADAIRPADAAAATRSVAEHAPGPQWSYILGEGLDMPLIWCPSMGTGCLLYML